MMDLRPFELRRAEQRRREREIETLYRAKTRDATVARWTLLLFLALAFLAAWALVVLLTSLGNGCGDVDTAPVALDGLAVRP